MTEVLVTGGREIALELHHLLRDLDPARWRADLQDRARARAARVMELARASRAAEVVGTGWSGLQARLAELAAAVEQHLPAGHLKNGEARAAWQAFRERVAPAYERLAQGLRQHAVHVPALRPTNVARSVFHVASSLVALGLLMWLPWAGQVAAAGAFAGWAWSMEILRRRSPRLNAVLLRHLGHLAHPHEAYRVNSSTWFGTGLLILALIGSPALSGVGLAILGLADPAAGLVGRRYGTIKLVHGRSLQGSATFFVVGLAAAFGVLAGLMGLTAGQAAVVALAAAAPATIVELFSRTVDDNLSIPLSAALGAWLGLIALGLAA
ncbi:MAG: hypothetical protein H6706_31190 [Myxococcales bacterium]|nr:hypothetical protein [Myxococcales bacterium]